MSSIALDVPRGVGLSLVALVIVCQACLAQEAHSDRAAAESEARYRHSVIFS